VTAGFYARLAKQLQTRAVGLSLATAGAAPLPTTHTAHAAVAANTVNTATNTESADAGTGTAPSTPEHQNDCANALCLEVGSHAIWNKNASSSSGAASAAAAVLSGHTMAVASGRTTATSEGYYKALAAPIDAVAVWQGSQAEKDDKEAAGELEGSIGAAIALPNSDADAKDNAASTAAADAAAAVSVPTQAFVGELSEGEVAVRTARAAWSFDGGQPELMLPAAPTEGLTNTSSTDSSSSSSTNDSVHGSSSEESTLVEMPLPAVLLPQALRGHFQVLKPDQEASQGRHRAWVTYEEPESAEDAAGVPAKNTSSSTNGGSDSTSAWEQVPRDGAALLLHIASQAGARGLELWPAPVSFSSPSSTSSGTASSAALVAAAALEAVGCAVKVWVVKAHLIPYEDDGVEEVVGAQKDGTATSGGVPQVQGLQRQQKRPRCRVKLLVEGPLPQEWFNKSQSGERPSSVAASSGGETFPPAAILHGRCWNVPLWVPDRFSAEALLSNGQSAAAAAHGSLACPGGLFPAPLPLGADGALVLKRFKFLGRLFGKVIKK